MKGFLNVMDYDPISIHCYVDDEIWDSLKERKNPH